MDGQLSCLIVGETPDIQFLGWRLSLGSAFIVLVSQYVSSDGLVSWKSTKLGANFYTPNVFAKELGELSPELLDNYTIEVIIISGISIGQFTENCKAVSKFANPETTVLVHASFGCELEEVALGIFDKNCKCVMSIACDVECRQLSLGSYALVNDNNCKVYLGLTYSSQNQDTDNNNNESLLSKNETHVNEELDVNLETNTNKLIKQLTTITKWIQVQSYRNSQDMAVKIWEMVIPKISLNILSVIYEQFDYDKLLEEKSNEIVFKDLVRELFEICYAQCNAKVQAFMNDSSIDFNKIVDYCKSKKRELIETTVNEYPEYLSLPFESYCFYHRFEYPAHILLYQPILLAKRYKASCSNLNFLYGFYSRLLSLSGLSIYGGRTESNISEFDKSVTEAAHKMEKSNDQDSTNISKPHPLWSNCRSNNELGLWTIASPHGNDTLLHDKSGLTVQMETDYLDVSNNNERFNADESNNKNNCFGHNNHVDADDNYFNIKEEDEGDNGLEIRTSSRNGLENMGVIAVPHFIKRYSHSPRTTNNSMTSLATVATAGSTGDIQSITKRPYTTTSLELQLRAANYDSLQQQLLSIPDSNPEMIRSAYDHRRRAFANIERQFWKLQRRHNLCNRNISRPKTDPYDDLVEHLDVLRRSNASDIFDFTTSRYGNTESSAIIQSANSKNNRKLISSSYETGGRLIRSNSANAVSRIG